MESAPPQLEARRHPTLYFSAGDVILATQKDGVRHLFRVHKSILSHNSLVFEDMFALPSSESLNETYDNAPVVRMHDDFKDLESLLNVFYDQTYVPTLYTSINPHCV